MNDTFQLYSIGFACQQLQLPIAKIRSTAERLGIQASSINGVTHYSESDVAVIREAVMQEMQSSGPAIIDQRANIS